MVTSVLQGFDCPNRGRDHTQMLLQGSALWVYAKWTKPQEGLLREQGFY